MRAARALPRFNLLRASVAPSPNLAPPPQLERRRPCRRAPKRSIAGVRQILRVLVCVGALGCADALAIEATSAGGTPVGTAAIAQPAIENLPPPTEAAPTLLRLPPVGASSRVAPARSDASPGDGGPEAVSPEIVQRLNDVERGLIDMRRQLDAAPAVEPPLALPYPRVALIGELQNDLALFNQDALNRATVGSAENGVDFRRARLAAVGQVSDFNDYRLEMDFALPGRPQFLDVYMSHYAFPALGNVRIGHFFEPFCMSRIIDNRFDIFMERPLLTVFAPARRTGFMTFGATEDLSATYAVSIYASADNFIGGNLTNASGWAGAAA